jgi:hypothetical protein
MYVGGGDYVATAFFNLLLKLARPSPDRLHWGKTSPHG